MYWLFTLNYLRPYKGYFDTEAEAILKLKDILNDGYDYYLDILKREVETEKRLNESVKKLLEEQEKNGEAKDPNLKLIYRAKDKLKNFTGLTKENLESSIKLLNLEDDPNMKNIFKTVINNI
jgi:hypothetical protein